MSEAPALVAVGYNRPDALLRLLASLRAGVYPAGAPLVVSLDHGGGDAVAEVADAFAWPHGPKRVIRHPANLGLRRHILSCGDLTGEYGAIALFEDDIVAAPHHHEWTRRAVARYGADDRIGGIALYGYRLNEFNNMDFEPIDDGSDVYFLQVAASWGQAWTRDQWRSFRAWYAGHEHEPIRVSDGVPRQLEAWRSNSWKRFYIKYLVATGRTFVYPRAALATNTARPGTNTKRDVSIYQTAMDARGRDWAFRSLDDSRSRYDVHYEPDPAVLRALRPDLADRDFDVDLYGTKPADALRRPMLLSARPARGGRRFGLLAGGSPVASILADAPGRFFALAPRAAFGRMTAARRWRLVRATQAGEPLNALLFQTLKPLQTELMIRRAGRAATRG